MASILAAFGVGDKSPKTDRSNQLNAWGDLSSLASGNQASGNTATGNALSYYSNLLSKNPTAVASAVSPVTNAATEQAGARSRQIASTGTSRGGGVNQEEQQTGDSVAESTQKAINDATAGAAGKSGAIGTTLTSQAGEDAGKLGEETENARTYDQNRSDKLLTDLSGDASLGLSKIPGLGGGAGGLSGLIAALG